MGHRVVFRPRAEAALADLYAYIRDESGHPETAIRYIRRIRTLCESLAELPERAPLRPGVGPGVRVLAHKRRIAIAYRVLAEEVEILGIFYAGQFFEGAFNDA